MPATLQRRLLRLLPLLGMRVLDVRPGTSVITRRKAVRVLPVDPDVAVVSSRKGLKVLPVEPEVSVVTDRKALRVHSLEDGVALVASAPGTQISRLGPGAHLVRSDRSTVDEAMGAGLRLVGPGELWEGDRAHRNKVVSDWLATQPLVEVLKRYRIDLVLDVGANKGQYARMLRRSGYQGRIASFEPVPEVFAQLAEAAKNDDLWSVHQMALGRDSAELEMHVVPGTMSSLLAPSEFGSNRYGQLREVTLQRVPVRRIDEVLPQLLPNDTARVMLKLDTQGYDLEAFAGLGDQSERVVALQSEVALLTIYDGMPRMPEALAVYEGAGFEVSGMYPVSREARTARILEYDCVMVRAAEV